MGIPKIIAVIDANGEIAEKVRSSIQQIEPIIQVLTFTNFETVTVNTIAQLPIAPAFVLIGFTSDTPSPSQQIVRALRQDKRFDSTSIVTYISHTNPEFNHVLALTEFDGRMTKNSLQTFDEELKKLLTIR